MTIYSGLSDASATCWAINQVGAAMVDLGLGGNERVKLKPCQHQKAVYPNADFTRAEFKDAYRLYIGQLRLNNDWEGGWWIISLLSALEDNGVSRFMDDEILRNWKNNIVNVAASYRKTRIFTIKRDGRKS